MAGEVNISLGRYEITSPSPYRASVDGIRAGVVAVGRCVIDPCGYEAYLSLRGREYLRRGYVAADRIDQMGRELPDDYDSSAVHYLYRTYSGEPVGCFRVIHRIPGSVLPAETMFNDFDIERATVDVDYKYVEVSRVIASYAHSRQTQVAIARDIVGAIFDYGSRNNLSMFAILERAGVRTFERAGAVFEQITEDQQVPEYGSTVNAIYRICYADAIERVCGEDEAGEKSRQIYTIWKNIFNTPAMKLSLARES